jgi:hypothetical protein
MVDIPEDRNDSLLAAALLSDDGGRNLSGLAWPRVHRGQRLRRLTPPQLIG